MKIKKKMVNVLYYVELDQRTWNLLHIVKAKQIWLCLNCDVDGILCTLKVGGYMHWFVTAATSHILSEDAYVGD